MVLTLFVYVELAGKFFTFPDYKSPFRDIYGFPEIAQKADELIKNNLSAAPKAIAVTQLDNGQQDNVLQLALQK